MTNPPPFDAVAVPQPAERRFSLEDVSALSGVSARTVRFYIQEGLVSRPEGAKRGSYYLGRHLEELLRIRRWSDAGLTLDRIRELLAGSPDEPTPRIRKPGLVEVWSRVTLADGLEVHIEPGRAGLSPEQLRALVKLMTEAYRTVRSPEDSAAVDPAKPPSQDPHTGAAS